MLLCHLDVPRYVHINGKRTADHMQEECFLKHPCVCTAMGLFLEEDLARVTEPQGNPNVR